MTEPDSYLGQSLGNFVDGLAAGTAAPAGGSAAALAVAMAAALCAKSARLSSRQLTADLADETTRQAEQVRAAAASLIDADALTYRDVIKSMRRPAGAAPGAGLAEALSRAADVPLRVTELAVQAARLAGGLAEQGNPSLRGDAICAALLANAGGRAAGELVRINLAQAPGDARLAEVTRLLAELDAAVGRPG